MYLSTMMLVLMIIMILVLLSVMFMENKINEMGESPFECGFEPISFSRTPFSMQFFSTTIVFLIFDLEIVILIPLVCGVMFSSVNYSLLMSLMVVQLILGLIIEWYDGSLHWTT